MLQKEQKAASLRYMSSEVIKAQMKRKDSKVNLLDVKLMIVVISLSESNFGIVLSAKGSDILGYTDEQLVGTHHSFLIPPPFNENHDRMLRNITKFRHKHPVYESLHTLYFMERSGCIVSADWKVCLVNLPESGALAILAAIRPQTHVIDVALVGEETRKIIVMVSLYTDPWLPTVPSSLQFTNRRGGIGLFISHSAGLGTFASRVHSQRREIYTGNWICLPSECSHGLHIRHQEAAYFKSSYRPQRISFETRIPGAARSQSDPSPFHTSKTPELRQFLIQ
jgi:PAS domain S-box-containing protein